MRWPDHAGSCPVRVGRYQVDALRGPLIGTPSRLLPDFGVLTSASALLGRLAR
nr:hypothetical protein KPHV_73590 [Kitasatospora purpeofusca]